MTDLLRDVRRVFVDARELGFLGPAPVEEHVEHSLAFAEVVSSSAAGSAPAGTHRLSILDLGSGAGVPGLILAAVSRDARVTLLDGATRRASWLSAAVADLELGSRVTVICQRAEDFGRSAEFRGTFDVVVSRSFGPPAVVLECAAPLLRIGGRLIVSEPPSGCGGAHPVTYDRWPAEGVAHFGFGQVATRSARNKHFAELTLLQSAPENYPRRVGIPQKRPRF